MSDSEMQSRDEGESTGRKTAGSMDDINDPTVMEAPSREPDEAPLDYYTRLDEWKDTQLRKLKNVRSQISDDEYEERFAAITVQACLSQKVAQKEEEIEEEIKDLDEDGSVMKMLETFKELPPIMVNESAVPSLHGDPSTDASSGPSAGEKRKHGGNNSGSVKKPRSSHEEATILDLSPGHVSPEFGRFQLNLKRMLKGNVRWVKSVLYSAMNERTNLSNLSESSRALHVLHCLTDVLKCLGLRDAEVAKEISFFSMRPDIIVLKYMQVTILAVEIKNEGRQPSKVMDNKTAAGQCLNYGFLLKQTGIETPIVCLSTYSQMRIGSTEPSIDQIVKVAIERLNKVNESCAFGDTNSQKGEKKPSYSPRKKGNAVTVIPSDFTKDFRDDTGEEPTEVSSDTPDRSIYFSETFDLGNMFSALYLAVACGYISAEMSQGANGDVSKLQHSRIPEEGQVLKDQWFNMVQEHSYSWTKVREVTATYALKTRWQKGTKIYMNCVLGMGGMGKVYLCMDSCGRQFAVKLMFLDSTTMEYCNPEEREAKQEEMFKENKAALAVEASRWKLIYPEYKKSIWEGTLNGVPCLAMPYVASLPMEKRKSLQIKIRAELTRIASMGYAYKDTDIRWRHIGLRLNQNNEEKIVLIDMESLVQSKDAKASADTFVEKCMKDLD